ncbi:MAG: tungsten formylmethanofuran dehydrogenase [Hyphomicrobiales bacterium]|nr:tungsten formylmethanofuran dehydrogenase [Hyphomicrobiales bacterium]
MPGRRGEGRHAKAWIEGVACSLDAAVEAALARLRESRHPLFAGLGCDMDGARSLVRLARRVGASIDHLSSTATGLELAVARDMGSFFTTPGEAVARADTLLVLGSALDGTGTELLDRVFETTPKLAAGGAPRRVIWVGRPLKGKARSSRLEITSLQVPASQIATLLAALRARLAGRPVGKASISASRLEPVVEKLREAQFGVAIWCSPPQEALAIEALTGLVRDLNGHTRFSCVPVCAADNAAGVAMALTWLTGFPSNIDFSQGQPEHDPWRFDAARLARSGEADLALWVSAYRDHWPDWADEVPMIALTSRSDGARRPHALVQIAVGTPGVDHDTVDYSSASGHLAFRRATARETIPSVAAVVDRFCAALIEPGKALR